jgi:hypothetical protein
MAVIKIQYKNDIRRVTVDKLPTYEDLVGLTKGLFGTALPERLLLKYKDEEGNLYYRDKETLTLLGDVISVTSDRELVEAFVVMKNQIARFSVEEVSAPASDKYTTLCINIYLF